MPEAKSVPATDPKPPKAPIAGEQKKPEEKPKVPDPKAPATVGEKKPEEKPKAPDSKAPATAGEKKPEEKPKASDPKASPATGEKKSDEKGSGAAAPKITVTGEKKVEIPIEKTNEKATVPTQPSTTAAKTAAAPKKSEEKSKAETPKEQPAADPKSKGESKDTAVEPPKGVRITQVFDDRLEKPTQKDLESLPIPGEGEGFSMRLHPAYFFEFLDHPFSVNRETQDYKELFDSIKENGINEPIKARPREGGGLELISGHRRHDVAMQLNYPVPVVIVQADDDTAQIEVVDGNLHRLDIPTSELARAAKMKIAAMGRKVGRRSKMEQLTGPQKRTDQLVAEEMGMSRTQLTRLVRIDSLVPEMKKMVDDKTMPFNVAVELSYMTEQEQHELVGVMKREQTVPSLAQAQKMKEASQKAAKTAEEAKRTVKPPLQIVSTSTKADAPSATTASTQPAKPDEKSSNATAVPNTPIQPAPAPAAPPPAPTPKPPAPVDAKQFASMMKNKPEPELKVTFSWAELKDFFSGKSPTVPEVKTAVFEGLGMRKRAQERKEQKQAITNPTR